MEVWVLAATLLLETATIINKTVIRRTDAFFRRGLLILRTRITMTKALLISTLIFLLTSPLPLARNPNSADSTFGMNVQ
jgi:hypothetical protein